LPSTAQDGPNGRIISTNTEVARTAAERSGATSQRWRSGCNGLGQGRRVQPHTTQNVRSQHPYVTAVLPELGEYRLVRPLDGRAESSTFLAHDRALDRAVVLRFLPREAAARRTILAAARGLARVEHPALCAVHRVSGDGVRPFVVLEYADGVRLDALGVPLDRARVLSMGRALGGALAALHAAEIAHGAVRPSHIVVSADGDTRLMGLGAARVRANAKARAADVIALAKLLAAHAEPAVSASLAPLATAKGPTAEGLLAALDALDGRAARGVDLEDNPYRGLEPFGVAHVDRFFGRQAPLARALTWLRSEPQLIALPTSTVGRIGAIAVEILAKGAHDRPQRG